MRLLERGDGWVRIGPLVLTTWRRYAGQQRNAFEIGREVGRADLKAPAQ